MRSIGGGGAPYRHRNTKESAMSDNAPTPRNVQDYRTDAKSAAAWLRTETTLTLQRWHLVAGGAVVLFLLLAALD